MAKKVIGVILLMLCIAVLFLVTVYYKGLEAATIAFGLSLLITAVAVFAAWLISGGE